MKLVRRLVLLSVVLGVLVGIGVGARSLWRRNGDSSEAQEHSHDAYPRQKVVLSGHVDVEEGIISLYPLLPGRVEKVLVRENDQVKKDAELLRLDDRVSRLKLDQAQADLTAAQAKYESAKQMPELHASKLAQQTEAVTAMQNRLSAARNKAKSAKKLFEIKQLSQEELDAALDQVKEGEAGERAEKEKLRALKKIDPFLDVRQAAALLDAKKAQLEEAKYALREQVLRAPEAGIVLRVNVGPGDILGPIPKDAAILFSASQRRIIRVNVEQEFAGQVKIGYAAEVQDYINPDRVWQGKVTRIADVFMHTRTLLPQRFSLSGDDTRTLECIVVLDDTSDLRLGQRVRVTIRLK
jgi:multidrug resistance efflux pump